MTSTRQPSPAIPFRRFLAERLVGVEPPLPEALLAVARTLADWQSITPLQYAGDPPRPIKLTQSGLAAYLAGVKQARAQGIPEIFRLANDADVPQLALFFDIEPDFPGGDRLGENHLPRRRSVRAQPGGRTTDPRAHGHQFHRP